MHVTSSIFIFYFFSKRFLSLEHLVPSYLRRGLGPNGDTYIFIIEYTLLTGLEQVNENLFEFHTVATLV